MFQDTEGATRCVLWKKVFLEISAKFTGKPLYKSLFFNKVAGLRPATLLRKDTPAQVFPCEFNEISKNTFFIEHLWTTASEDISHVQSPLGIVYKF